MPASSRSFLFLQGPQSRYFRRLGMAVRACGAKVRKVNLCGGDVFLWPFPCVRTYHGSRGNWPRWIADQMDRDAVTDLVLMGDNRPMHRDAICIARARNIRVYVVDEGYLRPNFVTFEREGVYIRSSLPNTPETIRERAATLPEAPPMYAYPDCMHTRVLETIQHHAGNTILLGMFPLYRTHRPYPIFWELRGWLPRYVTRRRRKLEALTRQRTLLRSGEPYFLFPLQLDSDVLVRSYSHYGVRDSIMQVFSSFANAAPPGCRLVVKNHPLDNGLINLRQFVDNFAHASGIQDRIIYLDGGQGRPLMDSPQCRGVVVVNSTMGLEALALGRPVFSLGKSIYALPGLAVTPREAPLEQFWTAPRLPDASLMHEFVKLLHAEALVPGNFYTDAGIAAAVEGSLRRLGLKA
ncbi:Capsule polysaccharide biosynthesis (plasmid) [Megalodesulfovibrio gigas DSM 1382 = ATCC 19364]|uniref:Capsule polysaccharide biosynthesis n=1 Tax=Megalodesulfovibrio gigas (strain ATCC 19364 / DSM 1382 / NCIMB 9332 / VKM B-1759) TaxID=1121448 RepID=T2GGJ1_MEGG1|nr:Capsule polysaccharide biosynthesis [Megalodesulfovibrio gigas DSM 1382 = ATCC 19364]